MPRKMGTKQIDAIAELIRESVTDQYRWVIMGPRESDRAVLVSYEYGARRVEGKHFYIVGFGGDPIDVTAGDAYPDPREFYPHA